MSALDELFHTSAARDLQGLVFGKLIGEGTARRVYEFKLDRDYVIKHEYVGGNFQNIHEYDVWACVLGTKYSDWFAPCRFLSPCGMFLVQKRTKPANPDQYPDKLPNFFCDIKRRNFGMIGDRFVAHDYGYTRMLTTGITNRMRKVDWSY